MNSHHSSTAIVLFARRAEGEAIHKTLLPAEQRKNLKLHKELIRTSKETAKRGWGTFLHYHEGLQEGNTFGERISNCAKSVFKQGFTRIIMIGGDCPDLSFGDINAATKALGNDKFVVGPDQHGGAYLIGFSKEQFDSVSFENLKWNTSTLFQDLKNYALAYSELTQLTKKIDLNTDEDLLINSASSQTLRIILSNIFRESYTGSQSRYTSIPTAPILSKKRRGPPVFI